MTSSLVGVTATTTNPDTAVFKPKPLWRGWIHTVGVFVLLALSPILWAKCRTSTQVEWVTCYVVGVGAMMTTSALFHRVKWSARGWNIMKRADHTAIFLAIAGSYLGIAGLTVHGTYRLVLLVIIGAGALIGVAIRQWALHAPKWANTLPYLISGWAAVGAMPQIYRGGGPICFVLIISGGVAYSVGAAFYGAKRPKLNPRVFGYHELFHACTIVGAGCHFAAIALALK